MRRLEASLAADGRVVVGADEAGRGPLAGPVVAAACFLPLDLEIEGLNDSKTLSEADRERIFGILTTTPSVAFAVRVIERDRIDAINILQAAMEGMAGAVQELAEGSCGATYALIDGPHLPKTLTIEGEPVVKGDARCSCIAAASVIAKVVRDRIMVELDKAYPQYGFAQHKGYGVRAHVAAIHEHGPCPEHRRTFAPVKHMIAQEGGQEEGGGPGRRAAARRPAAPRSSRQADGGRGGGKKRAAMRRDDEGAEEEEEEEWKPEPRRRRRR